MLGTVKGRRLVGHDPSIGDPPKDTFGWSSLWDPTVYNSFNSEERR